MFRFFYSAFVAAAAVAGLAYALTFVRRLGPVGGRVADACCRAPGLDVTVSLFTWVPWVWGFATFHWAGLLGAVVGQAVGMYAWVIGHEAMHPRAVAGPRIVKSLNRIVGRWQNHVALWVSVFALPGFLAIRVVELFVYPVLAALLRFPTYKQGEWVNCSRQKFDGLVGHDLVWCLYCDWMTGVYALGGELLRNVESFWCPIRFYDGKKCANCRAEFPDLDGGWVPADGTMAQVAHTLETMYDGPGVRAWFGHPVRLTVKGRAATPK